MLPSGRGGAIFTAGSAIAGLDNHSSIKQDKCVISVQEDKRIFKFDGPYQIITTKTCEVERIVEKP